MLLPADVIAVCMCSVHSVHRQERLSCSPDKDLGMLWGGYAERGWRTGRRWVKFSLGWSRFKASAHGLVIAAQIEQGGLPSWQAASHQPR